MRNIHGLFLFHHLVVSVAVITQFKTSAFRNRTLVALGIAFLLEATNAVHDVFDTRSQAHVHLCQ